MDIKRLEKKIKRFREYVLDSYYICICSVNNEIKKLEKEINKIKKEKK